MDRRQALAALEWRTLQCQAAPSSALRRRRLRDRADLPDTLFAPVTGWRRRPTAAPLTIRPPAARWAAPPLRSSHVSCARLTPRRRYPSPRASPREGP